MKRNISNNLSNNQKLTRSLLILFLLLNNSYSFCKSKKEKYLISNSGLKINFSVVDSVRSDTIFFSHNKNNNFIVLDSIAEYHNHIPGRGGRGFLIGAASGIIAGGIIGALSAPKTDYNSFTSYGTSKLEGEANIIAGASIGFAAGGLLGWAIGAGQEYERDIEFKTYIKSKKLEFFYNISLYK